jgi:hypothetical protein
MGLKRRAFFSVFGIGTAATVASVAQGRTPQLDTPTRDLKWAREMCEKGHRVRLASWITPIDQRGDLNPGKDPSIVTFRQGTREGVSSIDELAVTGEMLEGPWELVPEEDWPNKPPPPLSLPGGDLTILSYHQTAAGSGDITITGGTGGSSIYLDGKK